MADWFEGLDLGKIAYTSTSGLDAFLDDTHDMGEDLFSASNKVKVSSIGQLQGFDRVAGTNTLIRKSEKDLWALTENADGEFSIERLFDDDGKPLKL